MSKSRPTEPDEIDVPDAQRDDQPDGDESLHGSTWKGRPPDGFDWGERTQQTGELRWGRAPGHWDTDAYEMRQKFGIPPFSVEAFIEKHENCICYPDMVIHEAEPERAESSKGTDALIKGDRDAGKSTYAKTLATRLMDENGEKVVWRGSAERSGWLEYRDWTTLFLPVNADVTAEWMTEGEDSTIEEIDDLDEEVREVVYYEDVLDLLEKLGDAPRGTFNVVYPDPSFSGCEELTRETDRVEGTLPFTPEWEAYEETPATPVTHWWFAFLLGRIEYGPFEWMSLIFDEGGDLVEEGSRNDAGIRTYDKIRLLRSIWASGRKRRLSLFFFIHHEENMHAMIRREFKWRIHMPDDSSNPVESKRSTHPVGFKGDIPMKEDIMSDEDIGTALCYTKSGFTHFSWKDVPPKPVDEDRWLKISLGEPATLDATPSEQIEVELEFDDQIFGEWENQHTHRLMVKAPGEGFVSVETGVVGEELVSPFDELVFPDEPLRKGEGCREIVMERVEDDNEVVVARLPDDSSPRPALSEDEGVGA